MSHAAVVVPLAIVAAISFGLAVLAVLAARRSGSRRLAFVAAAFFTFAAKGSLTLWAIMSGGIGHETLEVVGAGFDLAVVILLVIPFLSR